MEHVPLQQRLQTCARLSTKFKAAAIEATNSIKLHAGSLGAVFGFQSYLQAHGSALTSLDLKPPIVTLPFALLELPCANLRKLQLTDALVQFTATPGSQQQGVLHSCKALTSLSLRNCNVLDTSAQLAGLSVLQDLQELSATWDKDCSRRNTQPVSLLPGCLLSQLVKLTRVQFSSHMRFADLQHLSCLAGLRDFQVALAGSVQQTSFAGVQHLQQLTHLSLSCFQSQQHFGPDETSSMCKLINLRALHVWMCQGFQPMMLRHMHDLRDVSINHTNLVGEADGTSSLLGMLPHLSAVTCLDLTGTLKHHAAQLSDYTALGTLNQLGHLNLADCNLPADLWQYLASAGVCMRSVYAVDLSAHTASTSQLLSTGLSSLVKCLPGLQELECPGALRADVDVCPLCGSWLACAAWC